MIFKLITSAIALALLTACDSPHPAFAKVKKQVITVEGSVFHVRVKDNKAQAIRTNFEMNPKIGDVFPKAAKAMEIASGCRVIPSAMKGDPALMVSKLDCG